MPTRSPLQGHEPCTSYTKPPETIHQCIARLLVLVHNEHDAQLGYLALRCLMELRQHDAQVISICSGSIKTSIGRHFVHADALKATAVAATRAIEAQVSDLRRIIATRHEQPAPKDVMPEFVDAVHCGVKTSERGRAAGAIGSVDGREWKRTAWKKAP